jgi:cell division protein ZapA
LSHNVQIELLGRKYTLRSHESEEQVYRVVRFVEDKLAEMSGGKSVDTQDLTALTLLNLAGQYLQLEDQLAQCTVGDEEKLQRIVTRLERELCDNSGC